MEQKTNIFFSNIGMQRGLTEARIADDMDQGQQQYHINTVHLWLRWEW